MKKAYEYSKMCGADVCLGIRLRDSGRVFTFMADDSGFWSKFDASLVRMTGVSQESVLISNRKNAIPFQFARLVLILHALPTIQILRSSLPSWMIRGYSCYSLVRCTVFWPRIALWLDHRGLYKKKYLEGIKYVPHYILYSSASGSAER
jgi:hypothetical protein